MAFRFIDEDQSSLQPRQQQISNDDGSVSTEESITIQDDRINGGAPTNIPTIFGGRRVGYDEAVEIIAQSGGVDPETGRSLRGFQNVDSAVFAARQRSNALGAQLPRRSFRYVDGPPPGQIQPKPVDDANAFERALDIGIDLGKGAVNLGSSVVGLVDMPTGGMVGRGMRAIGYDPEGTNERLSSLYSPERQLEEAQFQAAQGVGGKVGALLSEPATLVGRVAESVPQMLGSMGIAKAVFANVLAKTGSVAAATRAATLAASASEGAQQAGSSFQQMTSDGIAPEDAYLSSIGSGLTTAAIGYGAGRLGSKIGLGDVEAGIAASGGLPTRIAKSAVQEGLLEEMPQSATEQAWSNLGYERPIMHGVPESGAVGGVVGAVAGGGFGMLGGQQEEPAIQPNKPFDLLKGRQNAPAQAPSIQPEAETTLPAGGVLRQRGEHEEVPLDAGTFAPQYDGPLTQYQDFPATQEEMLRGIHRQRVAQDYDVAEQQRDQALRDEGFRRAEQQRQEEQDAALSYRIMQDKAADDGGPTALQLAMQLASRIATPQQDQSPTSADILPKSGKPFATEKSALLWLKQNQDHSGAKPVNVGVKQWVLRRLQEVQPQAEAAPEKKLGEKFSPKSPTAESTGYANQPVQQSAQKLSYDEFRAQYTDAFNSMMKYQPNQAGSTVFAEKMAKLADDYPDFADAIEADAAEMNASPLLSSGYPVLSSGEQTLPVDPIKFQQDRLKGTKLPAGFDDPRLKRYKFRAGSEVSGEAAPALEGREQVGSALLRDQATPFEEPEVNVTDEDVDAVMRGENVPAFMREQAGFDETQNEQPSADPIITAALAFAKGSKDKYHSYLRGRLPKSKRDAMAGEIDRAWTNREKSLTEKVDEAIGKKPEAAPDKARVLRNRADLLAKQSVKMLDGIEPGQPVRSTRDRNLRDKSAGLMRKSVDLIKQAEEIEKSITQVEPERQVVPNDESKAQTESPSTANEKLTAQEFAVEKKRGIVEHTTQKGKVLRGVVRSDLSKAQAQAIDPYTFRKDGGWFIREKHLDGVAQEAERIQPEQKQTEDRSASSRKDVASKLRALGEKTSSEAEKEYGRDRDTNTARKARMASNSEANAAHRKYIGDTMVKLADAIDAGRVKALAEITNRTQVEMIDHAMTQAMHARDRKDFESYADQQKRKGRPFEDRDLEFVEWPKAPYLSGAKSSVIEKIKGKRGSVEVAKEIRYSNEFTQSIFDKLKKLLTVEEIKREVGWWAVEAMERQSRLERAGINGVEQLKTAIKEFSDIRSGKIAEDPVKAAERALVGQNVGVDFFPTPKTLAKRMVEMAGVTKGAKVLEPSAGNGNIAEALRDAGADVDVAEISSSLRAVLEAKKFNVVEHDFMSMKGGAYDAIVMNPPFSKNRDVEHVRHAYDLLKPGGRLVAIMGEGTFLRNDATATGFRQWADEQGADIDHLPEGTFKDKLLMNTTGANARLVVIEKPAETDKDVALYSKGRESTGLTRSEATQRLSNLLGASTAQALLDSERIVLVEDEAGMPGKKTAGMTTNAVTTADGKMYLSLAALDANSFDGVSLHEGLHDTLKDTIGEADYDRLMKRMDNLRKMSKGGTGEVGKFFKQAIDSIPADTKADHVNDEVAAYAVERYTNAPRSLPQTIAKWAKDFLAAIRVGLMRALPQGSKLRGKLLDSTSEADLARLAVVGLKRAAIRADTAASETAPRYSKRTETNGTEPANIIDRLQKDAQSSVLQRLKDKAADWQPNLLGALTLQQLVDIGQKYLPQMKQYERSVAKMRADMNEMQQGAAKFAEKWAKWGRSNKPAAKRLMQVMHDATLWGTDPAQDFVPLDKDKTLERINVLKEKMRGRAGDDKAETMAEIKSLKHRIKTEDQRRDMHADMKKRFEMLPKEARDLYVEARDSYVKQSEEMLKALEKRINGSESAEDVKRSILDQLRLKFEQARLDGPYFPLARFGEYWAEMTKDGERVFLMFEDANERRSAIKRLEKDGHTLHKQGRKLDNSRELSGTSAAFMGEVSKMLDKVVGSKAEEFRDALYQLYLHQLPDLSMRKAFIHRQKVKGFSEDALRAYAYKMFHGASQIARLRHSTDMEQAVNSMKEQAKAEPDSTKHTALINEMQKRHQWIMNPGDSRWANKLTGLGFVWHLGLGASSALVNLTQTPVVAMPVIASRFGFGKTNAALLKASTDFIGKRLTADERSMLDTLEKRGYIDRTLGHDLAGIGDTPTGDYSELSARAMRAVSFLFHNAERFNREVTALTAYRLAGKGDASIDYAAEVVDKAHFNYGNENRARWMQSNTAKVLLLFKQYALNMSYYLWRNAYQAIKGESPDVQKAALKQLLGTLGMTGMMAGVSGLPLYGVMMTVANAMAALFGDDDEWDAEREFYAWLKEQAGKEGADRILRGPASDATGIDLASRTQLDGLWLRAPEKELEGKAYAHYLLEQAAGPVVGGIPTSILRGIELMGEGETQRGFEAMLPKFARDVLRAFRYADEGARSLRGDPLIDKFNPWELATQAGGFTPERLAERYESNTRVKNAEQAILDKRTKIMGAYSMALLARDPDRIEKARGKVVEFNKKHPRMAISGTDIRQSTINRARYSVQAKDGILVNRRLRPELEQYQ